MKSRTGYEEYSGTALRKLCCARNYGELHATDHDELQSWILTRDLAKQNLLYTYTYLGDNEDVQLEQNEVGNVWGA